MSDIVFLDTETTGLSLDDHVWEFAAIRRYEDGSEETMHHFIEHDRDKARALPLPFRADYEQRYDPLAALPADLAAKEIQRITSGRAHIVGAVPNFDTERLARLLHVYGLTPDWHYHLVDVESLAVGYLAARGTIVTLPWNSDALSSMLGIMPPTEERHTALGDARWARAIYDRIVPVYDPALD